MKRIAQISLAVSALLVLASASIDNSKSTTPKEKSGIEFFEGTWEEALAESEKTGKPVFLDAYASWCGPCKVLKSRVFTEESVGEFYNANFINVELDMERGEGKKVARTYRVSAYPSLFFVKGDGSVVKRAVGYHNPDQLINLGKQALEANSI